MKSQPPIRIGETGVSATHGAGGALGVTMGAGAMASATTMREVRGASPLPGASAGRRRRSPWLERLTSWRIGTTVVGISLVLWVISGVMASKFLGPRPRTVGDATMAALRGGPAIPSATLEALRQDAERARSRLIATRQELKSVLERMEGDARRRGWQVELSLSPPVHGPDGVEELIAYPVVIQLSPSRPDTHPGFGSLIEWLEGVSADSRSTKVTGVALRADGKRLGVVRVEIQVFGGKVNDQASPE
jgi:hypothetical protein